MARNVIMRRLRDTTREAHEKLEAQPFAERLRGGVLDRIAYVNYLHAMSLLQTQLEQTTCASTDEAVVQVWRDDMRKRELIRGDLFSLDAPREPTILSGALTEALLLTQQIRMRAQTEPSAVLGYLYVFEGSSLGGAVLSRSISRVADIGEDAVAYLTSYGEARGAHWKRFGTRMNAAITGEPQARSVLSAAQACFAQLGKVFRGLEDDATGHPLPAPVFTLNTAAGEHAITHDPIELDAALRAGESTLREFPYLLQRYGERGLQFTRSDSAWLISLLPQSQGHVNQDIRWLGQVLAARGMPRLILEVHLRALHAALLRTRPTKAATYARLLEATDMLRTERAHHISDLDLDNLDQTFEKAVTPTAIPTKNIGRLLGSAVADDANGVAGAIESLTNWLTDTQRFPRSWTRSIKRALARAQQRGQGGSRVRPSVQRRP